MRLREVKQLVQGHTASKRQEPNQSSFIPTQMDQGRGRQAVHFPCSNCGVWGNGDDALCLGSLVDDVRQGQDQE